MPETTGKQTDDGDDELRRRFAHLTDLDEEAAAQASDELPPVPTVEYERPKAPDENEKRRSIGFGSTLVGNSRDVKGSGIALSIGTNLVASIIVGTGLGWLADKYLLHSGATPWGLIVGFLLGVVSGFIGLVRAANQLNKD